MHKKSNTMFIDFINKKFINLYNKDDYAKIFLT
jgi:hypothetical protein